MTSNRLVGVTSQDAIVLAYAMDSITDYNYHRSAVWLDEATSCFRYTPEGNLVLRQSAFYSRFYIAIEPYYWADTKSKPNDIFAFIRYWYENHNPTLPPFI